MSNLVIVGDSFCSTSRAWPKTLANLVDMNLICYGAPGQHWWSAKEFIESMSAADIENTEFMILVHTFSQRLPSTNFNLMMHNIYNLDDTDEEQLAVKLYYKYIRNDKFMDWAQQAWFKEVAHRWPHIKIINLHSFPWSIQSQDLLPGMKITPCLASISLNELGASDDKLINDSRANHFNKYNNTELAMQLAIKINNYQEGAAELDTSKFQMKTTHWFNWH